MGVSVETLNGNGVIDRLFLKQTEFGVPLCRNLREHLGRLNAHRPLLIRDPVATQASGVTEELTTSLSNGVPCPALDVGSPLSPPDVDELGEFCRAGEFDCIVAVGGGATLDAAKLIALRAANNTPTIDLIEGNFSPSIIPIIAAPTTAGSGSEATHFAVLFVGEEKYSVAHPSLRPALAIIDPSLTHSVPQSVAMAAGLDVLCQSIESLWSRRADRKSIVYASEALKIVVPNLRSAVIDRDPSAQAALCLASHLAGQAINRSFTTICHALSYMLTARYGIPHGLAAAATLPSSLLLNCKRNHTTPVRRPSIGDMDRCIWELSAVLKCSDVESIVRKLVLLIRSIGGAASISELELPANYRPVEHAESFNPERLRNNPRRATPEDIVGILLRTFDSEGYAKL